MGLRRTQGDEKRIPPGNPLSLEAPPSPLSSHFPNKFVISSSQFAMWQVKGGMNDFCKES
jgi:hypothetical protein